MTINTLTYQIVVAHQISIALWTFSEINKSSPSNKSSLGKIFKNVIKLAPELIMICWVWISFVNSEVLLHDFNKYWMQKHVFRDIKRPYIKILTQPSKWSAQINMSSPSNKRVALRKKAEIDNCRGYYYSVGKSNQHICQNCHFSCSKIFVIEVFYTSKTSID